MSVHDFLRFYNETFKPIYADLVAYIADKPFQVVVEIENAFSHLCVYLDDGERQEVRNDNLKKAYNHISRATLDCYKLLWVAMNRDITAIIDDKNARKFAVNMSESDLLRRWGEFKKLARTARRAEMELIGKDGVEDVVRLYSKAIWLGWEILDSIDEEKASELRRFSMIAFIKRQWIGFLVGVVSGIVAAAIWQWLFSLYTSAR